jgi:hypothetical protein
MPPLPAQDNASNIDLSFPDEFLTHRIKIIKLAIVDTQNCGISGGTRP